MHMIVTIVPALAALGSVTLIGSFLFFCHSAQGGQSKHSSDCHGTLHRYRKMKNRLLKFCYVPATSAAHNRLLFFLFLLLPFTVLMKQTRQAVRVIKKSIFLDVYGTITCHCCQQFR
jgi:hypothetical protein